MAEEEEQHPQMTTDDADDLYIDEMYEDSNQDESEDSSLSGKKRPHRLLNQRRKIRKIRDESQLADETRQAQADERERRERVLHNVEEKLLSIEDKQRKPERLAKERAETFATRARDTSSTSDDVIIIGDDDDDTTTGDSDSELSVIGEVPGKGSASKPTVIDCTGVMIVERPNGTEDSTGQWDLESTPLHINDQLNVPDEHGQVLVNVFHPPGEPDVLVIDHLVKALKPHQVNSLLVLMVAVGHTSVVYFQIGGIRFLYSNVIERLSNFNVDSGFGCILAHCMGLGKTLQVIAFIDIFLRYTPCSRVLCVVPINTLQNWLDEFDKWLPRNGGLWTAPTDVPELIAQCTSSQLQQLSSVVPQRLFKVFVLDEKQKDLQSRAEMIGQWFIHGGVLLVGYEMYRMLALQVPTLSGVKRLEGKKMTKPKASKQGDEPRIDLDAEEEQMKKLQGQK